MKTKIQVALVLLIVISGFFFYHTRKDSYNLARELEDLDQTPKENSPSPLSYIFPFLKSDFQKTVEKGGSVNILIMGYGGEDHSGGFLTDTMILANMDFGNGELTMMNIPRDLYVDGEKINALYAIYLDPAEVTSILEELFGVKIDYYVTIDFNGFRQAVDEMGGLEIYVDKTFDDYNYPRHDNDQVDAGVMHIHFDEGWETMDGERALQYARSRYSLEDGGDYNRSIRQQKVIQAFKSKLLDLKDLKKIFNVGKIISSHYQTNFPYVDAIAGYKYFSDHEIKMKQKILSEDNYLYQSWTEEGSFILLPINDDWSVIKNYFESEEE